MPSALRGIVTSTVAPSIKLALLVRVEALTPVTVAVRGAALLEVYEMVFTAIEDDN